MLYKYSNSSGLTKNYVKYIKQKLFLSLTKFLSFRIGKKIIHFLWIPYSLFPLPFTNLIIYS